MPKQIHIDYDKIYLTARKGILRAAVFLGFGVNASEEEKLSGYHLARHTNFRILPEEVPPEVLKSWKMEFRVWIVGCGFRELVDRLCVFLDRLHFVSSLIAKTYSTKLQRDFEWLGLDRKIDQLEASFGIRCPFPSQLSSFYPVRNCFVHRLGRVGLPDTKDHPRLCLRFMRFSSVFTAVSGEERTIQDIFDPNSPPFQCPEDGTLGLRWTEARRCFARGEWISLTPKDLTEVLFFSDQCAIALTRSAIKYAKAHGIQSPK